MRISAAQMPRTLEPAPRLQSTLTCSSPSLRTRTEALSVREALVKLDAATLATFADKVVAKLDNSDRSAISWSDADKNKHRRDEAVSFGATLISFLRVYAISGYFSPPFQSRTSYFPRQVHYEETEYNSNGNCGDPSRRCEFHKVAVLSQEEHSSLSLPPSSSCCDC